MSKNAFCPSHQIIHNSQVLQIIAISLMSAAIALSGCGGGGSGSRTLPATSTQVGGKIPPQAAMLAPWGQRVSIQPNSSDERLDEPSPSGELSTPADTDPPATWVTSEPSYPAANPSTGFGAQGAEPGAAPGILDRSGSISTAGMSSGGQRLVERPRNNPDAADLLDHWGHRRNRAITNGLSLKDAVPESSVAHLQILQAAAQSRSERPVASNLEDNDVIRLLGARGGITYGRWKGGPADTLLIDFDLSEAGPLMKDDPAFRSMLERAGKVWSHRIADTWTMWGRSAGEFKGWVSNGLGGVIPVWVGPDGETSTGLEIHVRDVYLPGGVNGRAKAGVSSPVDSWEPRFGSIEVDREHLQSDAGKARLFSTLAHEIGHLLGAWTTSSYPEHLEAYVDTATGTWKGPNVVALHGGPAPFQDASDEYAWHQGERDPHTSNYDFNHSGVCASIMAYCRHKAALPPFLPSAIDFAFLADLGMTITEETDRPETYGLAGWTDYAAFTVSVSRRLGVSLAEPQPHYGYWGNPWQTLDVIDLLWAEADAFGYLSTGNFRSSHLAKGSDGMVRYTGGLIGAALDRKGLPPVVGDASLAVDLATLDGTASFTSLEVLINGTPEIFAGGTLHYPFDLSSNAIIGTGTGSTFQADFYGPRHEDVAGLLHDPRVGLLAAFGATLDNRPEREELIASADYLEGLFYNHNPLAPAVDGWHWSLCGTDSVCKTSYNPPGPEGWTNWTATTRESVLDLTAGWALLNDAQPHADHDPVRIERYQSASTDGGRGRHMADGYAGTLEYISFGTGFEVFENWGADSSATSTEIYNKWTGVQGNLSGRLPGAHARWTGRMVGYHYDYDWSEHPFVGGRATVDFQLSTNRVDVSFSEVTSLDSKRTLPDFGFEGLEAKADGTFMSNSVHPGMLRGAFFGPAHEEAGGMFQHNEADITGSFGARRNALTLRETGTTEALIATDGHEFYTYNQWGFWGKQFSEKIFGAFLEQDITTTGKGKTYYTPYGRIEGTPSGHNPVSGTAVWSGKVRAFEMERGWVPVSGNARLEVDFNDAKVNVDFTDFEAGHNDISWRALRIEAGAFSDSQGGQATIEGAFYGTKHQGVAGKFERDRLRGVFGAMRD